MKRNFKYSIIAFSVMTASMNVNAAEKLPAINVIAESSDLGAVKATEVDNNQINKNHAVDLKTAIKDVPGVEVISLQNVRQGNDSVNIRGLSGNRVGMSIDGINLPEANENKHVASTGPAFGRGAYIEPSSLKTISISKNSNGKGIAGSVNLKTLSPSDILKGKKIGGYFETSFNSIDDSVLASGAIALSKDNWRTLVLASFRQGYETKNKGDKGGIGSKRTKSNPTTYKTPYIIAKHEVDIDNSNTITFTAENIYKEQTIDFQSELSDTVTKHQGDDTNQRSRLSLNHHYQSNEGFVNNLDTTFYWQRATTKSETNMEGTKFNSYTPKGFRKQIFDKTDNVFGFASSLDHHSYHEFNFANIEYIGQYNFDISYQRLTSNLDSNYSHFISKKPVADSILLPINLSADNDIKIDDFVFNFGLGMHYYYHKPDTNDKGYIVISKGDYAKIKTSSDFNVTPKVGLSWQIHELAIPYAQYTRGFKAPSPQQLTSTMYSVSQWGEYSLWGNPNLESETSNNFDLGIKGNNEEIQYNLNAYYNIYNNFIDFVKLDVQEKGVTAYQAQNKQQVTIYGVEASAKWAFYEGFSVNGMASYAKGKVNQNEKETPLNSIDPLKIKIGFAYDNDVFGANLDVAHHFAKKDKDIHTYDDRAPAKINPSVDYTLIDIGAYYKPTKNLTFNANINNLLDKKYWKWSDIAYLMPSSSNSQSDGSVSMNNTNKDRYTSPGVNFNLGVKYTF